MDSFKSLQIGHCFQLFNWIVHDCIYRFILYIIICFSQTKIICLQDANTALFIYGESEWIPYCGLWSLTNAQKAQYKTLKEVHTIPSLLMIMVWAHMMWEELIKI